MFVLKREPGGQAEFLTLDPAYTAGNAFGSWTPDPKVAFGFAREKDAVQFKNHFKHFFTGTTSIWELKDG